MEEISIGSICTFDGFNGDSEVVSKFCHPFGWLRNGRPHLIFDHPSEGDASSMYENSEKLSAVDQFTREYTNTQYSTLHNYNDPSFYPNFCDIVGLEAAARLLVNTIGKPRMFPNHYGPNALCETQNFACIYGLKGSGKATLVKAFSKRYNINLLIVDGSYNDDGMMGALLEFASINTPCIMYFDDCDHFFGDRFVDSRRGLEFIYHWKTKFKTPPLDLWVVFGTTALPEQLLPWIRTKLKHSHNYAQAPNEAQRRLLFYRFLQSKYDKVGYNIINPEEFDQLLQYLAQSSMYCTPHMISAYCDSVFQAKRANCSMKQLQGNNASSEILLPDRACYNEVMTLSESGARICQENAKNLQEPYLQYQTKVSKFAAVRAHEETIIRRAVERSIGNPPIRNGQLLHHSSNGISTSRIPVQEQHTQTNSPLAKETTSISPVSAVVTTNSAPSFLGKREESSIPKAMSTPKRKAQNRLPTNIELG